MLKNLFPFGTFPDKCKCVAVLFVTFQDVGAKSKDFNNLSGKYTMELIVGDAVIENPITWLMVSEMIC